MHHRLRCKQANQGPLTRLPQVSTSRCTILAARRAGVPLATLLGGAPRALPAYASGIDSRLGQEMVANARAAGYQSFKMRIGFRGLDTVATVGAVAEGLRDGERLMVDANQAWDCDEAVAIVSSLSELPLRWVEEPLPVDAALSDWKRVAAASAPPNRRRRKHALPRGVRCRHWR